MKLKDTNIPVTDTANKASAKRKSGRNCFCCEKLGDIKVNGFKWPTTDEEKEYTENKPSDDEDDNTDEAKQTNQNS